jgi:excisionase family DNA binding protein
MTHAPTPAPDMRRIGAVAAQVGVSTDTLYRAIKSGALTKRKQGRNMTFLDMAQVQQWIEQGGNAGKVE